MWANREVMPPNTIARGDNLAGSAGKEGLGGRRG